MNKTVYNLTDAVSARLVTSDPRLEGSEVLVVITDAAGNVYECIGRPYLPVLLGHFQQPLLTLAGSSDTLLLKVGIRCDRVVAALCRLMPEEVLTAPTFETRKEIAAGQPIAAWTGLKDMTLELPDEQKADEILKTYVIPVAPPFDLDGSSCELTDDRDLMIKGPMVTLCDGRQVRAADMTTEDWSLVADPNQDS